MEDEIMEMAARDTTLERLFESLSKSHPELAPILEDATDQPDLEIRVNDAPVLEHHADAVRLRDGDTVSLLIHEP
jgi:molybdopterin converting factor small subunit